MENLQRKKSVLYESIPLLALVIGLWMAICAHAAQAGSISGSNVNVRSDAGAGCKRITSLNTGDAVTVKDTKQDSLGKTWYLISFTQNGSAYEGYVIGDYLTITGETEEPAAGGAGQTAAPQAAKTKKVNRQGTVLASGVNVRKKAVSGAPVGQLGRGDVVFVLKSKKAKDGNKWYRISFTYGGAAKKGWVRSDFVKLQKKNAVTVIDAPPEETPAPATEEPEQPDDMLAISLDATRRATVRKDGANVRKKPVNGKKLAWLKKGQTIGIIKNEKAKDGKKWYYISYAYEGTTRKGWIRSDRIKVGKKIPKDETNPGSQTPLTEAEFEAELGKQGFPDSYKAALRTLHTAYPGWTFRAVQTGLDWTAALDAESKTGVSLVSKLAIASWKSAESTAYDWKKNVWYTFDGGSWAAASRELVAYQMDPRNFLDENGIFQFESLEYEPYQNEDGVKALLKNSFMKGDYTEPDGTTRSYAASFVEIGKAAGVSPYHLAARCYQEQGLGKSPSISGMVAGYENIFNYYNIGAYASGKNTPSTQGLIYASTQATKEELNYERPWNTRYKSLLGGAEYVAEKYVKVGQNTLYFQKFNVVNTKNGIYKHQYMTNVQAAEAEAKKMSKAYTDKNTQLVFYIPVYGNMPASVCAKPTGNLNPNNYLSSIKVDGFTVSPEFDGGVEDYYVTVSADTDQVKVSATSVASTSTVEGAGVVALLPGENDVVLQCTSQSGQTKEYIVHITR